ncbi:MAG: energy transducer TonB [Planctomycetes bacterium]|nr:energy transducer TonB [Planctomycetota bacterium]
MALTSPTPGSGETGGKRSPIVWIAVAAAALLAVGAAAFFFLGGSDKPKKRTATVVNIMPVLPPPPPPTPPPTPPPAPPDPVEPPPDAPEFVEETTPDSPPEPEPAPDAPAPMGSNIQGDGPPDGFGLVGKGGGGMIGGRGQGGGAGTRFGWYAGRVQNAVTSALRTHQSTRASQLSLKARIWVDASGRVTRASLEGSSGDRETDRALQQEILTGLRLPDPPPEDMPMPIVMRINASRP